MTEMPDVDAVGTEDGIAVGDVVEVLSAPIPRYTVRYLLEAETATLEELADVVTGWENADTGAVASKTDRDRLRIDLYHVHLPRLDAMDVVAFDPTEKTASLAAAPDTIEPILEWVDQMAIGDRSDGH